MNNDWQPIESAPRDGTAFLAYGYYVYEGDNDRTEYFDVVIYSGDPNFPWATDGEHHKNTVYSHWQPLPRRPEHEQ